MNLPAPASPYRSRRKSINAEEDRAWVSFYRRVGKDPMIAAEVIEQLESDAQMKRDHLALYLCCRESLRLHQARAARNQRVGQFISQLFHGLVVGLPAALRRTADRGDALAAEMLPETVEAPAGANVRQLIVDPKIRSARATVGASASKRAKAARAGI